MTKNKRLIVLLLLALWFFGKAPPVDVRKMEIFGNRALSIETRQEIRTRWGALSATKSRIAIETVFEN
jgi:hypothetical protein